MNDDFQDEISEASAIAQEMGRDSLLDQAMNDVANALAKLDQAIEAIRSMESPDMDVDFNPEGGRAQIRIKPEVLEQLQQDAADLGEAEKEYMVYQRKADEDGKPVYGFDYLRSVGET